MLIRARECCLSIVIVTAAFNSSSCWGDINVTSGLKINFTNLFEANLKAVWAPAPKLDINAQGLGWDGESIASIDGWIQTRPMALGCSWRPTTGASMQVAIRPVPAPVKLANGQTISPYEGSLYVRYSPDRLHWSTWQALQQGRTAQVPSEDPPGRFYHGAIQVPQRDREAYQKLLSEYSQLDVPWKSDEEAAATWIVERDPEFFAKHLPFVGYVEFLFESGFPGGQRIESLAAEVTFGMGGFHAPPPSPAVYEERGIPWRFEAEVVGGDSEGAEALKRVIPLGKCSEISIETATGWWLRVIRDGSGRMGYGASAGDAASLPKGSLDFPKIHRELAILDFDGGGLSRDPSIAFHRQGAKTAYGMSTTHYEPIRKIFEQARNLAKDFDKRRLPELWKDHPPVEAKAP